MSKLLSKFKRNTIDEFINSVDNQKVSALTISAAGTGYVNTETVSLFGGTTFTVTTATGPVTDVTLVTKGVYNNNVPNSAIYASGGTGTGLRVNVSFENENNFYVFVGKQSEYPTSDVAAEVESETDSFYDVWNEMMFGKKPTFKRMVPKYTWTTATVYTQYDDQVELKDTDFFVITDTRDVFKCISNNGGANSTVKPTKSATYIGTPFQTGDNYKWLYMYTVAQSDKLKFTTNEYIPVTQDALVANAAVNGGIFHINVEDSGVDYPNHTGTITTTGSDSTIIIANTANTTSNYYRDSAIAVTNTSGNTFVRKIGTSNTAYGITITSSFPAGFLSNTCTYSIGPLLTITSRTGSNASAYAVMNSTTGAITRVNMAQYGTGYKDATVTATAGTNLGIGAELRAIISPDGGHGSNVYDELYCDALGVHCLFDEYNSTTFNTDVTYRTVGLLKNPTYTNGTLYAANTFNQLCTINITGSGTGTYANGEVVTGSISTASGRYAFANSSVLVLTGVNGTFQSGEVLQGANGAQRIASSGNTAANLAIYSGDILYVQNIQEVSRSTSNKEQVKLVIRF
jgi:hypothetical protein